ncbi:MAG: hypothetical protein M1568_01415 [Acidobacteria bacterium]|jgi:hypothetical protein|nr:hypothetical protein [Acidobacteriota bacterium]
MTKEPLKYVQVDYVPSAADQRGVPWVLVAVDSEDPDGMVRIIEAERCWSQVEADDKEYLEALLADWKKTSNRDGDALLASLGELSLGPIRTASTGQCAQEDIATAFKHAN